MTTTNGDMVKERIGVFIVVAAIVIGLFTLLSSVEPQDPSSRTTSYPAASGYIVDESDILSPDVESLLTTQLTQLNDATGIQIAVVTIPTTNGIPMPEYSIGLAETWGIGDAEADSGILFITATEDRQTRFEIGYGMEGILTDSQGGRILDNSVIPHFKNNDFETGIVEGVGALIHHVTNNQNVN